MHKVTTKDGKTYIYAWRGGPRIDAPEGTKQFEREYKRLLRERDLPHFDTLGALINAYRQSPDFRRIARSTRISYDAHLVRIMDEFKDFPLDYLAMRGVRGMFLQWRDEMAATAPSMADHTIAILRIVLSFGLDREIITFNPLLKVKPVARATRRDNIWSDELVDRFMAVASPEMQLGMMMALWTGQRRGDLLKMKWSDYDGTTLKVTQEKTGAQVLVPVASELKVVLDGLERRSIYIMTSRTGRPWGQGFRASWERTCKKAGITGVTFHDLRGTFVARAHAAGASISEIAYVTGHQQTRAERMIRSHYLPRSAAVERIELWRVKSAVKFAGKN